ncbi:putative F-box and FNIP repeat-containing protein [Cotonvirus japonicus]|uniref:F-box and FNIP repeat-containing protein n=1 Tax=Cotonvirus japonicus TaxID=2811091 RepID=A0ABM7NTX9_9VIRU|nr:putative F-box and FNIP repeat-containing protein [Cotonvirus japonicus]BCS83615.1 putative F-box and FNIP repeat-containing protein [Cotonvirus japonicus]
MDILYDDIILCICKYLTSKEIIYFLSINKTLNVLKNHVYYDETCDYNSIKNLEYYSRFRKIINVPHINDVSENVTYVCFSETFNDSIKDKLGKNISCIGFPKNYDKNVYESIPLSVKHICYSDCVHRDRYNHKCCRNQKPVVWDEHRIVSNESNISKHYDKKLTYAHDFIINENDTISILNNQNHVIAMYDLYGNEIEINNSQTQIIADQKHPNQEKINHVLANEKINSIFTIGLRTFVFCHTKNNCEYYESYIFDSESNFIGEFRYFHDSHFGNVISIIPAPTKLIIKSCSGHSCSFTTWCPICSINDSKTINLFPLGSYIISFNNNYYTKLYTLDYGGQYISPLLNSAGIPHIFDGKIILRPYYKNNKIKIFYLQMKNNGSVVIGKLTLIKNLMV